MEENKELNLVTALGTFPDLVLELLDFFNYNADFPYPKSTLKVRQQFFGASLTNVYLLCTASEKITAVFTKLQETVKEEFPKITLHNVPLPMADIASSTDDARMQQEVKVLFKELSGASTIISSAGRKTLTQRLLESASKFGCLGYLAIIGPDGVTRQDHSKLAAIWTPSQQILQDNWQRSQELNKTGIGSSFRSLAVLPLMVQEQLHKDTLGTTKANKEQDLKWLKKLPKADLHCHLGGCQDEKILKTLARQLLLDLQVSHQQQQEISHYFCQKLHIEQLNDITTRTLRNLSQTPPLHCLNNLSYLFADREEGKHLLAAVLIAKLSKNRLRHLSRDSRITEDNEIDWPKRDKNSLNWYMACGDLGGSTLLQSPQTLRLALRQLMEDFLAENGRYLEVRCSPGNYTKAGLLTIKGAMDNLLAEAENFMAKHKGVQVNLLIMATRHKSRAEMASHVAAAILYSQMGKAGAPRVAGFDLAGQEQDYDPTLFQDEFMPLHRHFMNITIHAGEMTDEEKIWQAIYLLHAKRIGHGLKLVDNPQMMAFIRDHGLSLEMCPSSNHQTNSFATFPKTKQQQNLYPLHQYLHHGIEVTINTDNRFISNTTMSNEYWQAAAMSPGGLSKWQILKLLRSSFQSAFLPKDSKDKLLKEIDDEIFTLVLQGYFGRQALGKQRMENVFCLARTAIEEISNTPLQQGFLPKPTLEDMLNLPHHFISRPEAEGDPAFKQIIPYQLFCCKNRYFVFQRGAKVGEKRLSGRLSLGIGGHINDKDTNGNTLSHHDFHQALIRERDEELLCPVDIPTTFAGWINDESDEVGKVHLGAVYICQVNNQTDISIRPNGEDLHTIGWLSKKEILTRRNEFEKWSILALESANRAREQRGD